MTRRRYVMATAIAASAFAAAFVAIAVANPLPRAIWNASASAPIGLYRIHPDRDPAIGALVAVAPPERLAHWLSTRGYLPEGVPLLWPWRRRFGVGLFRTAGIAEQVVTVALALATFGLAVRALLWAHGVDVAGPG